jgi:arylsulfatase A-like enzyme
MRLSVALVCGGLVTGCSAIERPALPPPWQAAHRPTLVVVIVVDQLRADYVPRLEERFVATPRPGGFRYFLERGAYYPQLSHHTLHTMTAPGHLALLSGAYASRSGIVGNGWFDTDSQRMTPGCVDDGGAVSPGRALAPTLGDTMKTTGLESRVVSVSPKDRAAVMMGGFQANLALWFDEACLAWVTSAYYEPGGQPPEWVRRFNASHGHQAASPFGVPEMETTALALAAVSALEFGQRRVPDLLAVSYSGLDLVGHERGPNSPDAEASLIEIDLAIAALLEGLDRALPRGLDDAILVLTGDHGAPPLPAWARERKLGSGHLVREAMQAQLETDLRKRFGPPGGERRWIVGITSTLNIYLDHQAMADRGVSAEAVEGIVKQTVSSIPGVLFAFSATDHRENRLPAAWERLIQNSYFAGRSGDVVAVPQPFWMADGDPLTHTTGYAYDRMVPLFLAGAPFRRGVYAGGEAVDVAPTLAFVLGILPPAMSQGRVLSEALAFVVRN